MYITSWKWQGSGYGSVSNSRRIRIELKSRIRIRIGIKMNSTIRVWIRIKRIWIRNIDNYGTVSEIPGTTEVAGTVQELLLNCTGTVFLTWKLTFFDF
jgi:hypothetical protein